jgi:TRAP-type transport system small permease protein
MQPRNESARGTSAGMESAWKSLCWVAANLEEIICAALLAILVAVVSAAVVSRYVFNAALPWPEELSRFALVALTFFGAALATKREGHIVVDFVGLFLPARARLWMAFAIQLVLSAFLVLFATLGVQMVQKMWVAVSPALAIHMGYVYLCIPLGTGLMILHLLRQMRDTARALRTRGGN